MAKHVLEKVYPFINDKTDTNEKTFITLSYNDNKAKLFRFEIQGFYFSDSASFERTFISLRQAIECLDEMTAFYTKRALGK